MFVDCQEYLHLCAAGIIGTAGFERKKNHNLLNINKIMTKNNESKQRHERPLSPCIMICTLDDERVCLGCGRTLAEVGRWATMSVSEQWEVIDRLTEREDENGATIGAD